MLVSWSGGGVQGLAANVLHFAADTSVPDPAAVLAAYAGVAALFPTGVVITVPNGGDVIEDTTGELVDVWSGTGGGQTGGSSAGARASGVGACVTWLTGGIINGRRLRGRTFLVPLTSGAWDTDGTFQGSTLGLLDDWADDMQASGPLAVWHRPTTTGGSDGNSYGVIGHRITDKTAILTSRRD